MDTVPELANIKTRHICYLDEDYSMDTVPGLANVKQDIPDI